MTPPKRTSRRAKGLSLGEMLLSLAITGALLAAVAVAFQVSLKSYGDNQNIADAAQMGRSTLERLAREVRTADEVTYTASQLTLYPPAESGIQSLQYDFSGDKLYYRRTVGGTTSSFIALENDANTTLTLFRVTGVTGVDFHNVNCTKTITVELNLTVGHQPLALTVSASPRRNQL